MCFFFVKQKTAYEMRISDWSSDVCSSDLLPGVFYRDGREVDAPLEAVTSQKPLTIMKYQVSAASYRLCVADGACAPSGGDIPAGADPERIPATGINFNDARAYAAWFRSEARRVGKECAGTGRSRGSPY